MQFTSVTPRIACPGCGRGGFATIPGSRCFCGCGAVFLIRADGKAVTESEPKQTDPRQPQGGPRR
jgi:hypothetical protein